MYLNEHNEKLKYNMKRINNLWIYSTVFIIILVALFFFLGLGKVIFIGPQGIHFMRQTDSLSFASQYYNNGYNFFNPQLFNLKNINGAAACEFPIIYYITSLFYFLFGKNLLILKFFHFTIVSFGIFYIFRLIYELLEDYFYAIILSLIFFTSTVFNYYSFNYLPDAPALGFTFIGWYYYFRYRDDKQNKTLLISFVFFILGSLIKVTYLINPITIIVFSLFSILLHKNNFNYIATKRTIIYGILGLGIVLIWNVYILYYNSLYESKSFNTRALPIWGLSNTQISEVWDYIIHYWYTKYFAHSSFHLLFIILLFQIIFYKKCNNQLCLITLILFSGSLFYFILFYSQFKDHDYYFLTFLPLIILVLINGLKTLQNISKNKYLHMFTKLVLLIIIIVVVNYSRMKLGERYKKKEDAFTNTSFLIYENLEVIKTLNIPVNAKFIVAPDLCQNGGLFYLNRMGWNIEKQKDITINKINYYKKEGADYLLLASNNPQLLSIGNMCGKLILKGKGITVFKLKNTTP